MIFRQLRVQLAWLRDARARRIIAGSLTLSGTIGSVVAYVGGARDWDVLIAAFAGAVLVGIRERLANRPSDIAHETQRKEAATGAIPFPERRGQPRVEDTGPYRQWPDEYETPRP